MSEMVHIDGLLAIPELIRRSGVSTVFAMLGGTNAPWLAAGAQNETIRVVRTRHEDTAINAATAFGRVNGHIGICSVTRGPGFANGINALLAARHSHLPVVLIVAESPSSRGRTPQDIDQKGFTTSIGAGFHHVSLPGELENQFWTAVGDAIDTATPQVLSVADVVIESQVPISIESHDPLRTSSVSAGRRVAPDLESLGPVLDAIEQSSHPLILGGQGAVLADAHGPLIELADLIGARLSTTLLANHMFAGHERNLGLSGTWSAPVVREELAKTDLILAFGTSLDPKTTEDGHIFAGARIVHCEADMDRPLKASSPELAVLGDARLTAEALIEAWRLRGGPPRPAQAGVPEPDSIRKSIVGIDLGHNPDRGLDLRHVYTYLDDLLPKDRIVVVDVGRFVRTLPVLISAPDSRAWITARGHGSVGLGLGLAIGATVADPSRPVTMFCGDGGLMMMAHDLDCARVNDLDLTIFIMNDEQLGADVNQVRKFGLPPDILRQPIADVPQLAASMGGVGFVVRTMDELAKLDLEYRGLTMVDIRLDPDVNAAAAFG